ncbi:hypothetical protein B8281_15920 [Cellulosimicrobium sp. TH-20]|nr:hypothetical protein B8281_15920 [Cellulosimicrobium sp. TH-20]
MREAIRKVGHGSTAGAKLIASGVLPTVSVPGYVNPRVSLATLDLLHGMPSLDRHALGPFASTLIVRCGGPQRAMAGTDAVDWETGRAYYGFHTSMTMRTAVLATAGWWTLSPRMLGTSRGAMTPGAVIETTVDRLWVTVGGFIVLDATVDAVQVSYEPAPSGSLPLSALYVSDAPSDMVGRWLPPTRSGSVTMLASEW